MATKKTFYIVSDNIQSKSKDKARMKAIGKAFASIGHKYVITEVGSNAHTNPKKWGCTKKNDVWCYVVGGACAGTIADLTGYTGFGTWFKNSQLKKASLMMIFVSAPEGKCVDIATIKKLGIAHDDYFSKKVKGFTGIKNPSNYLQKKGVTWIQDGTTTGIVNKIKAQQWNGSQIDVTNDSSTKEITNSYTVTHGFDDGVPFEAYLKIDYTVNDKKGKLKTIYIDWSSEAPSNLTKFNNDGTIIWNNDEKHIHEINILDKIKSANGDYGHTKTNKYYLKKVTFMRDFQNKLDDKDTEQDESKLYEWKTDQSSYKMKLYDIGLFSGEVLNPQKLGVSGKTLLDGVKSILDKANYEVDLTYGNYRTMDTLTFREGKDKKKIKYTFNEGFDGDVLGISNVKYSPTKDLVNDSIVVYNTSKEDDKTKKYHYTRKAKLGEVLRYGEQSHIEDISESTAYYDATQKSYDNLMEYYKPTITYTLKAVGLAPLKINDWVETKMVNPLLDNEYQIASRKITINVDDRPMIQTEWGLGDIDAKLKVKNNLAQQRKKLVRKALDINESVQYYDKQTDDFMDMVWVD